MFLADGVPLAEADRRSEGERCGAHRGGEAASVTHEGGLKIQVRRWEKFRDNAGEFVGGKRTLAGPYRFGFDGTREVVIGKYRQWLHGEIKARGTVFGKLRDLLPLARTGEGLVLVCVEPEIGEVIARALQWMEEGNIETRERDSAA